MNKYQPGSYHLIVFGEYGNKIATLDGYTGLHQPTAHGEFLVGLGTQYDNFVVVRVIKNSKMSSTFYP